MNPDNIEVDVQTLIDCLKLQRNRALDDAAIFSALVEKLKAEIKNLKETKPEDRT